MTGSRVIRETTQTGCPWSGPRVSLSIYLSIYLGRSVCGNGRRNAQDELWSSPGFENVLLISKALAPTLAPEQIATPLDPVAHSGTTRPRCTFAARSLSLCRPLLLALCLFLLTLHPRPVRASVTASRTRGRRWHIGPTMGVNGLVLCVEVSWFSVLVMRGGLM